MQVLLRLDTLRGECYAQWDRHLVIQNWIRYGKAAEESPDIRILPSQNRVNPHHLESMN